jgi:hypothetical protein
VTTPASRALGDHGHTDDHNSITAVLGPMEGHDYFVSLAALEADASAALQAAVTALEAADGGRIHIPRGSFTLDSTVVTVGASQWDTWGPGGIEFVGAGMRGTRLIGPVGGVAIQVGDSSSKLAFAFRDLTISGAGSTDAGSIGIDSRSVGGSYVFDNVLISDLEQGIRYYDNTLVSADHLNVRKCGTGLSLGYFSDVHANRGCRFDFNDIGVYVGY